jgi:hypothetical protein
MNEKKLMRTPRLAIDIEEDDYFRMNKHIPQHMRSVLFRKVLSDVLDLMDNVGGPLVTAGILSGGLKIEDYTTIVHNLKNLLGVSDGKSDVL